MRRRYIPPIMDWLNNIFFPGGNFLGIEWHVWKVIGWMGNITFTSRFFVQWYYTEKMKQVVVPVAFWWLSLIGASLLGETRERERLVTISFSPPSKPPTAFPS